MNHRAVARFGLGYLSIISLVLGVWAWAAPRSFYDNFPGLGMAWVSVDGPYNEHLLRDVGALNLALAVLLIAAFIRLTSDFVRIAAGASLVWNVPHAIYHTFNTGGLETLDILLNLASLSLSALYPMVLLYAASRLNEPTPMSSGATPG